MTAPKKVLAPCSVCVGVDIDAGLRVHCEQWEELS